MIDVSSPRTRRYFQVYLMASVKKYLFSAHAEVFPVNHLGGVTKESLLRARGGISTPAGLD